MMPAVSMTNVQLSEALALASEGFDGNKQKALRRAARRAMTWPEEVAALASGGRDLTELPAVGPWVRDFLLELLESPPEIDDAPRIRSGFMSFAHARAVVSENLDVRRALKADLQMHSVYSDGHSTIRDMAVKAIELGHEYIAMTDHSKGLKIAGGMDEDTLANQGAEIDDLNQELASDGFRVLRALEMNISPDGSGDMEPDSLTNLDLVLGSFHSKLRIKEDQTERYLAALRNPHVHVLGHPRGRIFNFRMGLKADWIRVFEEAARLDKAVEVDCHPNRQDLDVPLLEVARDAGVRISIGTDAHDPEEMEFVDVGVATVVEAGFPLDRVLNMMPVDEVLEWTASHVGKA